MQSSGSELEAALQAALERRRRAKETPFSLTPLGAALAAAVAAANEAEAAMSPDELEQTKIRGERMRRRGMRAEARRMTLQRYQAHLRRVAALTLAAASSSERRDALRSGAITASRSAQRPRPRQQKRVHRARARAPAESDEPEPPRAASRVCACGCGEPVFGRPNRRYVDDTHGARARVRKHRNKYPVDLVERYCDEVWSLRARDEIDALEALELLIAPPSALLARMVAAA